MTEKKEISLQDFVVGATICVEFFQFCAMGPDYKNVISFFKDLTEIFSINLDGVISLKSEYYWIIIDAVLVGILFWVILCAVVLFRLDERYGRFFVFRILGNLGDKLMPILGNLCFVPFVSILLENFVCDQSIGENFTDSFLAQDCYQFC